MLRCEVAAFLVIVLIVGCGRQDATGGAHADQQGGSALRLPDRAGVERTAAADLIADFQIQVRNRDFDAALGLAAQGVGP